MGLFRKKSKIFIPDLYAQQHYERVKAGMKDEASMKKRWMNEIAPLLPPSASGKGISLWTARLFFFSVSLPSNTKGNLRDKEYHISHSRYAMLDFCIYSFFEIRKTLCVVLRRRVVEKIEDTYFEYLVKYFTQYFGFSEAEINCIIDNRLDQYAEIMQTPQKDIEEAMLFSACQFLLKDFISDPMERQPVIASADKHVHLCAELSALMHAEYIQLKSLQKDLSADCFLD